ncbi:DinB family protein [Micromonospora sp. NPDC050686]|uniref:DinB family protein n=1 Tax=Micromonospora sp. NPDC050686 TaxID=3154631 RepID=UPI0033FD6D65
MGTEYAGTDQFRGATFQAVDLTGATFRDCDLTGVRIVSSEIADLRVSGFNGTAGRVVVDDVDVTAYVSAELDRRHPERVRLRAVRSADDHRAMWATVERLWAETIARAERLPEPAQHERVDGDWSLVETLRHLVFAADTWVGRMILGEAVPHHRFALPPTDYPSGRAAEIGVDLAARPAYAEVLALHANRMVRARRVVADLTDAELDRVCTAELAPVWGTESHPVGECLRVLMGECCAHRRYAERDLAVIEARRD